MTSPDGENSGQRFRHLPVCLSISVGAALLYWRFAVNSLGQAEFFIWNFGYYAYHITLAAWLICTAFLLLGRPFAMSRKNAGQAAFAGLAAGAMLLACGRFEVADYKVNYDEPLHANVAKTMHEIGVAAPMISVTPGPHGLEILGYSSSHRSALFSYFTSLVHDFRGYDPANPFLTNIALTWCAWMTLWALVRTHTGDARLAFGAMVLFASVPVCIHSAFSAQCDVANLLFVALLLLALLLAHRDWNRRSAAFLCATGVMAALARSESILFLGVIVAFYLNQLRKKQPAFVPPALVSLIPGLILVLSTQIVLLSNPANLTQNALMPGESVHQWTFLFRHLKEAGLYFFSYDKNTGAAPHLALAGATALLVATIRRPRNGSAPGPEVWWLAIAAIYALFYIGLLASFWSGPRDILMERFTLQLWLFITLGIVAVLHRMKLSGRSTTLLPVVGAVVFATFTLPRVAAGNQWEINSLGRAQRACLALAAKHDDGKTLFLAPSNYALINENHPAIPAARLSRFPEKTSYALAHGIYRHIFVFGFTENGVTRFSSDTNDIAEAATLRPIETVPMPPAASVSLYEITGYSRKNPDMTFIPAIPAGGEIDPARLP